MRRLRPLAALALAFAATIGFSARALGQQSDKQQELQQQVNEASAAENAARAKVVDAQAQRQRSESALADVTGRLAAANDRLASAQATVDRLGLEALVLQVKVDATVKKLTSARNNVRRSAVLLYRHGTGTAMIGLLGSADGSGELVEGKHYLQRVNDKRQDDARRVSRLKAQLDAQRDAVAQQKQDADAARAAAADEKAQLDELAAQQARARSRRPRARCRPRTRRWVRRSHRAMPQKLRSQPESQRIAEQLQSAGDTPASGDGTFIRPVPGPITSGFGYRTDPVTGATAYHAGHRHRCPVRHADQGGRHRGDPSAGFNSGGYGNMTLINHGNGLSTLYGHQSSIIVSPGQSVTQGQVIGYVGSTGKSTGCHLHFEVRVGGNPVDPNGYL